MGFREELQKLSIQINERKEHIINEEMTKQALIIPFLQTWGYDVFNPLEVRPEYVADFGKKKGEKVDYAIFKDEEPIAFLEAKAVNENLSNHNAQLSRYFNAVPDVKLGILTNGIEYRFFTDLNENNIMDESPFFKFNITNLTDLDIENLTKFKKDLFDSESLIKYAEEFVYTSDLDSSLKKLFKNPSDEFVRFLIKDFSDSRITNNVIERFRPIVKKAISNAVLDIVSKGLYQEECAVVKEDDDSNDNNKLDKNKQSSTNENKKREIVTTKEELEFYDLVKDILKKHDILLDNINYKDTTNYFSIYTRNTSKWIIRLQTDISKKNIMTKLPLDLATQLAEGFEVVQAPKGIGQSRIYINSIKDIEKLEEVLLQSFNLVK